MPLLFRGAPDSYLDLKITLVLNYIKRRRSSSLTINMDAFNLPTSLAPKP
jgi:hypothetical protein